jgi:hypothetical protein
MSVAITINPESVCVSAELMIIRTLLADGILLNYACEFSMNGRLIRVSGHR